MRKQRGGVEVTGIGSSGRLWLSHRFAKIIMKNETFLLRFSILEASLYMGEVDRGLCFTFLFLRPL